MLVLSRRVGERLLIGDDVVVTVIEVRSDGVRLGIEAPREVRVHRAEVIEAVRLANVEAVAVGADAEESLRRLVPSDPSASASVADGSPSGVVAEPAPAHRPAPPQQAASARHPASAQHSASAPQPAAPRPTAPAPGASPARPRPVPGPRPTAPRD